MEILQKLALSKQSDKIYFFRDGMFLQVFHASLYLAVVELGLVLKVMGHRYKKLNNQLILCAGLPSKTLEKRFNYLTKTDFGYTLSVDYDFNAHDYLSWYQTQFDIVRKNEAQKQAKVKSFNVINSDITTNVMDNSLHFSVSNDRKLLLTEQEYDFLKNWQQDKYPTDIELRFIRGLHLKIIDSDK